MWKTRLTLTPGANGTKKQTARYGSRLICVRYRHDPERRRRIKTVELVEEESPHWRPSHVPAVHPFPTRSPISEEENRP